MDICSIHWNIWKWWVIPVPENQTCIWLDRRGGRRGTYTTTESTNTWLSCITIRDAFSSILSIRVFFIQKGDCKSVITDECNVYFPRCPSMWIAAAFCCCIYIELANILEGQLGQKFISTPTNICQKNKRGKRLNFFFVFVSNSFHTLIFLGNIWPGSLFQHSVASYYLSRWL